MDKQTSEEMQRAEREQWKASDQFMNGEISATQLNQIEQQYVLSIKEAVFTLAKQNMILRRLGHPVLTTSDAIAQSLAIGPIFSAAFVAFLIAGTAGSAAPLATLLGALGVLALCWVISLYAKRYTGAGAIYDYLRRVNPVVGLFSAGMYFIGTLVLDSVGYIIIGLLVVQTLNRYLELNIPWWVVSLAALVLIFTVNHLGIRVATRVQLLLFLLSLMPIPLLAIIIIVKGGDAGNTLQAFNPLSVSPSALFSGVLFGILLFIGFETSASLGEETANPHHSIPRAVFGSFLLAAVFYLLVIYASTIGFGLNHTDKWAFNPSALDLLATRYVGRWLAVLVDIALLLDAVAVVSAFMATTARGWFAVARAGLLPKFFARTSPRFRTPLGGNLLVLIISFFLIVVTALAQWGISMDIGQHNALILFGVMSTIGALLIETIYIILAVCAVRFVDKQLSKWWQWIFLLIALIMPLLGIVGSIVPFPTWPTSLGVYGAIAGLVIAAIWTFAMTRAKPDYMRASGEESYSWEHKGTGDHFP